jgi:hypothetical protein
MCYFVTPTFPAGLISFSAIAPAAALLTFFLLRLSPGMNQPEQVALVVLFSGGTVLYAACIHILPSVLAVSPQDLQVGVVLHVLRYIAGENCSVCGGSTVLYAACV